MSKNKKKFEFELLELLPPLEKDQVDNLIKFMRRNAGKIEELHAYESCCASDDSGVYQGYIFDALRGGYGLLTPEDIVDRYDSSGDYDE